MVANMLPEMPMAMACMQVDLHSERGTSALLYSTPAALDELKPGAHHDFVVGLFGGKHTRTHPAPTLLFLLA